MQWLKVRRRKKKKKNWSYFAKKNWKIKLHAINIFIFPSSGKEELMRAENWGRQIHICRQTGKREDDKMKMQRSKEEQRTCGWQEEWVLQLKSKVHEWRLTKKEGKSERETCGNWSWKMRAERVMQEEDGGGWRGGEGAEQDKQERRKVQWSWLDFRKEKMGRRRRREGRSCVTPAVKAPCCCWEVLYVRQVTASEKLPSIFHVTAKVFHHPCKINSALILWCASFQFSHV